MRIIRTSSGVDRRRIEVSSALMQPDLPEPVVPAMSRCGMRARSVHTAVPEMSLPSHTESGLAVAGMSPKMSPSVTRFGERFGSSTPTACLPGIGARSEEHTAALQSQTKSVSCLLPAKKKRKSTRLKSRHSQNYYVAFGQKKKKRYNSL